MKRRIQIRQWLWVAAVSAVIFLPGAVRAQRVNGAAQSAESNRPPKPAKPAGQDARPPQRQNQERRQGPPAGEHGAERPNPAGRANRPAPVPRPVNRENRPPGAAAENRQGTSINANRPPNAVVHPRELSPEAQRNLQQFERLSPQQKREMTERVQVWNRLTPDQRTHLKTDVVPKWNQLPPNRQRAIRQRLGVLQNMPEAAKNQHLNDPNFTRGMSEEDQAMLRDLSHMHVGAPDPPRE